jgi:hypothetical protein
VKKGYVAEEDGGLFEEKQPRLHKHNFLSERVANK